MFHVKPRVQVGVFRLTVLPRSLNAPHCDGGDLPPHLAHMTPLRVSRMAVSHPPACAPHHVSLIVDLVPAVKRSRLMRSAPAGLLRARTPRTESSMMHREARGGCSISLASSSRNATAFVSQSAVPRRALGTHQESAWGNCRTEPRLKHPTCGARDLTSGRTEEEPEGRTEGSSSVSVLVKPTCGDPGPGKRLRFARWLFHVKQRQIGVCAGHGWRKVRRRP